MDYAERRRLKIWGRARLVDEADDPALIARLEEANYRARVERAVVIAIEAFDWNCPQHITPRFTEAEIAEGNQVLHVEIAQLRRQLARHRRVFAANGEATLDAPIALGRGPLALVVAGVRQLAGRSATSFPAARQRLPAAR